MVVVITCFRDKMSPMLIAALLVQLTLAKGQPVKRVDKEFHQCNVTCFQPLKSSSSEEWIRRQLDLFKKSSERLDDSDVGDEAAAEFAQTEPDEGSFEQLTTAVGRQPLSEHSEILLLLTEFANLIHLMLLTNPSSHQLHPDVWQSDLLVKIQPEDNFTTIFHKLEDYNRAHESENFLLDNQGHYIWVPYGLLKAIHKAITVEQQLASERKKLKDTKFELINTGVPILAKKRKRVNCVKYARAYQKLKEAEEEFLKLTSDLAQVSSEERDGKQGQTLREKLKCNCGKGVTVVASKLK